MKKPNARRSFARGFVLTETCASLALVGLILGVVSLLLSQHGRASDHFLVYRRVQLAAESCVEQMRAGALDSASTNFVDENGVAFDIHVVQPDDQWQPLLFVTVTASSTDRGGRTVKYALNAYVSPTPSSKGIDP